MQCLRDASFCKLFSSWTMARTTILVWMLYLAHSFVFYGMIVIIPVSFTRVMTVTTDPTNIPLDALLAALVELPTVAIIAATIDSVGVKALMAVGLIMTCICCVAAIVITDGSAFAIAVFCAKFFLTLSFNVLNM